MMKNINQNPNIENTEKSSLFETEQKFHKELQDDLYNEYLEFKYGNGDPERIKTILQCINGQSKHVRSKIAMIKRERIERQGYDTHAGIAKSEYDKAEEAKKNAEKEAQQKSNNNSQPDVSEQDDVEIPDETEQPDENPPEMTYLHSDIKEIEENLPVHDEPKKLISNITVVAPTPIIKYKDDDGFRPHAKMCDFFKSHAPIKIAGGTYDSGKTYSCVY